MAESPNRYCGNCGNELSPEDQFCRNCGTPAHQAARVPTPEADVPVPPPPQPGGSSGTTQGATTPAQPAQEGGGAARRHPILAGCLAIVALFLLLGIVGAMIGGNGGGGGQQAADSPPEQAEQDEGVEGGGPEPEAKKPLEGEKAKEKPKPQPQKTYSVGQTAKVGNVVWTVKDAYRTNQLKSGFGTQKRGTFVVVDFTFVNNRDEEVTLDPQLHMTLKDSQGREFGSDPDAWEFVPTDLNLFLEPVNPGVSQDGRVVYEVGPDAKGFTLTLDDVEFLEDKSAVFDLGVLTAQDYSTASASASAGQ